MFNFGHAMVPTGRADAARAPARHRRAVPKLPPIDGDNCSRNSVRRRAPAPPTHVFRRHESAFWAFLFNINYNNERKLPRFGSCVRLICDVLRLRSARLIMLINSPPSGYAFCGAFRRNSYSARWIATVPTRAVSKANEYVSFFFLFKDKRYQSSKQQTCHNTRWPRSNVILIMIRFTDHTNIFYKINFPSD
ncbi:hypothetical protein EVAR_35621_1 [Eumeta japonica]|uniref:Uncharacterized protein n=1 Tax=Eumeta variegata TaxID=151549 RepID=A0A4C1WDL2_EUMVA|nr:hypothetical protein EVAR_35621_1 [Eumeta japonica]